MYKPQLLLSLLLCTLLCAVGADFVNTKVTRTIDLSSQLARHTIAIAAESKSGSQTQYVLPVFNDAKLAFIKATDSGVELQVTKATPVQTGSGQRYSDHAHSAYHLRRRSTILDSRRSYFFIQRHQLPNSTL